MTLGHRVDFRRRGVVFVSPNAHLTIIPSSKLVPPHIAETLVPLQCETARKDLSLKDLSQTTPPTKIRPISLTFPKTECCMTFFLWNSSRTCHTIISTYILCREEHLMALD